MAPWMASQGGCSPPTSEEDTRSASGTSPLPQTPPPEWGLSRRRAGGRRPTSASRATAWRWKPHSTAWARTPQLRVAGPPLPRLTANTRAPAGPRSAHRAPAPSAFSLAGRERGPSPERAREAASRLAPSSSLPLPLASRCLQWHMGPEPLRKRERPPPLARFGRGTGRPRPRARHLRPFADETSSGCIRLASAQRRARGPTTRPQRTEAPLPLSPKPCFPCLPGRLGAPRRGGSSDRTLPRRGSLLPNCTVSASASASKRGRAPSQQRPLKPQPGGGPPTAAATPVRAEARSRRRTRRRQRPHWQPPEATTHTSTCPGIRGRVASLDPRPPRPRPRPCHPASRHRNRR